MDDEHHDEISLDESDNSDEDEGILFQKATITTKSAFSGVQGPPLAPPSNLIWQEGAIVKCFELAVQSHGDSSSYGSTWRAMPLFAPKGDDTPCKNNGNNLAGWEPQPLQLPLWAVATIESENNRKKEMQMKRRKYRHPKLARNRINDRFAFLYLLCSFITSSEQYSALV